MRKLSIIMAMALVLCGALALSAQAFVIDLEIGATQTGASVAYAGPNVVAPLIGTNLIIDKIQGNGTPANAGALNALVGTGHWNFTTGNFTGFTPEDWNFGSGGSLSVTGPFSGTGSGTGITVANAVTSGTWIKADVDRIGVNNAYSVSGAFTDLKTDDLLAYFGLSSLDGTTFVATFNFGLNTLTDILPPNFFTSTTVTSGDISNVPVPPSLLLLGSGLLGMGVLRFRKGTCC